MLPSIKALQVVKKSMPLLDAGGNLQRFGQKCNKILMLLIVKSLRNVL